MSKKKNYYIRDGFHMVFWLQSHDSIKTTYRNECRNDVIGTPKTGSQLRFSMKWDFFFSHTFVSCVCSILFVYPLRIC